METRVDNTESLTLAALFYEIGRFKCRANGYSDSFLQAGHQWLQSVFPPIAQAVQDQGNSGLIEQAAKLAAGFIDGGLPSEPQRDTGALISIFSVLDTRAQQRASLFYYPQKISSVCQYPVDVITPKELTRRYKEQWQEFDRECQSLKKSITVPQALLLLERNTSYIPYVPSPPNSPYAGISLFDHAKLTAALASCLRLARKHKSPFLLVGGDFSGVQDFVYRISSKGALKALRGRSFFLELLAEHVIAEILRALELSAANIVVSAGAIFNLLLPNTEKACNALKFAQQRLNQYLLDKHDGKLYLALASVAVSNSDLANSQAFAEKWRELGQEIAKQKGHKFSELLRGGSQRGSLLQSKPPLDDQKPSLFKNDHVCPWCGSTAQLKCITWQEEEIYGCATCLPDDKKLKPDECQICHRIALLTQLPPPRADVLACSICRNLYHLGEHLYDVRYVIGVRSDKPNDKFDPTQKAIIKLPDLMEDKKWIYYYFFKAETPPPVLPTELNHSSVVSSFVINKWDLEWYSLSNTRLLALGNYPGFKARARRAGKPLNGAEEVPLEFAELVERAKGMKRLGVLCMDVDNLGDVFIYGLKGRSLAHRMALSRAMTYFFKLHLNELCLANSADAFAEGRQTALIASSGFKMRHAIIVYSGGDDLFIVGTWNDIVELAFDIHQAFEKYTGGSVTLSAGVIVQDENFPLYQMARFSKKALSAAKANCTTLSSRGPDKDSFALFHPSLILELQGDSLKAHTPAALRWPDAHQCRDLAQEMAKVLGNGRGGDDWELLVSRSLLHNLFKVVQSAHREEQLSLPKLAYALSRVSFEDNAKQEQYRKLAQKLMSLETLCYLHPALVWLEMRLRREESRP